MRGDTTVQPKFVAFPTDVRLMHAAIVWLGRLAKRHGVPLRLCLSNNAAERALKGFAVGRRGWLFAGSNRGGERAAAI